MTMVEFLCIYMAAVLWIASIVLAIFYNPLLWIFAGPSILALIWCGALIVRDFLIK